MKKFRILGLMAATMILAGATANAQERNADKKERPTAEQVAAKRTAQMTEALSLTEEQAKQIAELNLADAKRAEAQRDANRASRDKMKQILTPEQYKQWKAICREGQHRTGEGPQGKSHMHKGAPHGKPGMGPEGKGPHHGPKGCCPEGQEGKPCCKKGPDGKPCCKAEEAGKPCCKGGKGHGGKKGACPDGKPAPEKK